MSYESNKYYNGNLYASITKNVENQQLFMDLHVGIGMDVKKPATIMRPICGYCNGRKNQPIFMRPICGYCNGCKKPTIMKPICEYYIFEMTLWKL